MGYWSNLRSSILGVEKLSENSYFHTLWETIVSWSKPTSDNQKIAAILENPAALYIFLLLPELFSLGRYRLYQGETEIEKHPLLDLLRNPNPMQTGSQFKWDYMFNRKLGTANLYIDSKIPTEKNRLYFLKGDNIVWPKRFEDGAQDLILSDTQINELKREILIYRTRRQELRFPYEKLIQFFDISNGIHSWYGSPSRIDALYKIIANSENSLKSKNINSSFASKFIVAGKMDISNTSVLPMTEDDKSSIREAMKGKETIYPTKTQVNINRFIESGQIFKSLDEAYMNDAFLIGKMLNIPKDVIEMIGDSTYENQEKARAAIISYCIQPDAEDFCSGVLKYFKLDASLHLELDYSHLPFVQVFEREKAEAWDKKASALLKLIDAGADQQQAADLLELGIDKWGPRNENRGMASGQGTDPSKLRAI